MPEGLTKNSQRSPTGVIMEALEGVEGMWRRTRNARNRQSGRCPSGFIMEFRGLVRLYRDRRAGQNIMLRPTFQVSLSMPGAEVNGQFICFFRSS